MNIIYKAIRVLKHTLYFVFYTKHTTPRRTTIDLYLQDLGIDPSLIRPIDTATSSRKNKSRKGITIRKNRQPVSIGQSSNSQP